MFRERYAGLYHALIFGGFLVLALRRWRSFSRSLPGRRPAVPVRRFLGGYLLVKDVVLVTTFAGSSSPSFAGTSRERSASTRRSTRTSFLLLIGFLMVTDLTAGAAHFALLEKRGREAPPWPQARSGTRHIFPF